MRIKGKTRETISKTLITSVLISLMFSVFLISKTPFFYGLDFGYYFAGGKMVLENDNNLIYEESFQQKIADDLKLKTGSNVGFFEYNNTPFTALLFSPFSVLAPKNFYYFVAVLNLLLIFAVARQLKHIFSKTRKTTILLLLITFIPTLLVVIEGQIVLLLFYLLLFSYIRLMEGREATSAAALSAVIFIKPQFFLLLPFFYSLAKRKKVFAKNIVASAFSFLLIWFAVFGMKSFLDYPKFIMGIDDKIASQPTFLSFLFHALPDLRENTMVLYFISIAVFAAILFIFLKREVVNKKPVLVIGILLALAFSPHAWEYDHLFLIVPILFFISVYKKSKSLTNKKILAIMATLLWSTFVWRWVLYPFYSALVLILVALTLIFRPVWPLQQAPK